MIWQLVNTLSFVMLACVEVLKTRVLKLAPLSPYLFMLSLFYLTWFKLHDLLDLKNKKKRLTFLPRNVASADWPLRPPLTGGSCCTLTVPPPGGSSVSLSLSLCVCVCVCVFIALPGGCGRTKVHIKPLLLSMIKPCFSPKVSLDEFIASETERRQHQILWIDPFK